MFNDERLTVKGLMTNDDAEVTDFMKSATVGEILANEKLWGEDLSDMLEEVTKYADK